MRNESDVNPGDTKSNFLKACRGNVLKCSDADWSSYLEKYNITNQTFGEYYLGEIKDEYTDAETEYIFTEVVRDILGSGFFSLTPNNVPSISKELFIQDLNVHNYYVTIEQGRINKEIKTRNKIRSIQYQDGKKIIIKEENYDKPLSEISNIHNPINKLASNKMDISNASSLKELNNHVMHYILEGIENASKITK